MIWAVSLLTTKLSPRRLTHRFSSDGIRSWLGGGNQHLAPIPGRPLPPSALAVAAPQCISGRTSYLHVRLAFHPYPPLIPQFCNTGGFEPRRTFTSASLWPWVAHVVSGRLGATSFLSPSSDSVSLGLPSFAGRLTCNTDALAGSFYKRHAISPCWDSPTVASDCL